LALLSIRFCEVRLQAPERQAGQPALHLWAVEARETHPPAGAGPILWRLLSTVPVTTAQEAIQVVGWYAVRWQIEVFHKIVKSVCRGEDYQLERAQRLQRVLMIDLVVAWRIQVLTQVGRQNPDLPAGDYFAPAEWRALASYMHGPGGKLGSPPRLGQMMHWIGRLGGFVRCKANPNPGPITLARGLARLNDLTTMYVLQNATRRSVQ
jgi:hypothetical protein